MLGQELMTLLYKSPEYRVPDVPGRVVELGLAIPSDQKLKEPKACRP